LANGGEQVGSEDAKTPTSAQHAALGDATPTTPALLTEDAAERPQVEEEQERSEGEQATDKPEEPAIESECARKPQKTKPSFDGEWKMVRYEGDWEAWMLDVGVGWAMRKAASATGYGVNATWLSIKGTQDEIRITCRSLKGTTVQDVKINGSEQDDLDFVTSKQIKVIAEWEDMGDHFSFTVRAGPSEKGTVSVPLARRFLLGDEMILEWTNCKDALVRMVFAKKS